MAAERATIAAVVTAGEAAVAAGKATIAAVATAGGAAVAAGRATIAAVATAGKTAMVELYGSKKSYYSSCGYSRRSCYSGAAWQQKELP